MSLGKPTEMTLRDLLVEELKRRGVVVELFSIEDKLK